MKLNVLIIAASTFLWSVQALASDNLALASDNLDNPSPALRASAKSIYEQVVKLEAVLKKVVSQDDAVYHQQFWRPANTLSKQANFAFTAFSYCGAAAGSLAALGDLMRDHPEDSKPFLKNYRESLTKCAKAVKQHP